MYMKNTIKYNGKLNAIGNRIKEYRIKNNMTQKYLSEQLQLLGIDINVKSLLRLENGNRIIKEYELSAFEKIFNVSADELLDNCIDKLDK